MVIDVQFFGYGAGLVMCGFIAGVIVNSVLSSIRGV